MPNQLPYGFMGGQPMNNFNPNMMMPFENSQDHYKITELEKRISNLEKKVSILENELNHKQNYDYQTSMNMM